MLPFFVPITDTSPAAQAVQLEMHRSMTGEQKIRLAYEMSMFGRELNRARLRQEHPEWTEAQITRELLRLAFFPKPLPSGLK
jgi:Rv0078B-related antitoxin